MQLCTCTIAIDGDAGLAVSKHFVTIPELMILRAMHGEDAVRNIVVTGDESIDSGEERERLQLIYKRPPELVRQVLGPHGALPKTLDEAGIDDEFVISAPKKRGGRPRSATEELRPGDLEAEAPPVDG